MELGQYQLQIFVGLVVVLAAAFVALICDFLKSNNEQLRELTIELKVRREEEQRHSQTMMPQTVPASAPALRERLRMERIDAMAAPGSHATAEPAAVATVRPTGRERKRPPSADAMAAMARGAELAATPGKWTAALQREREFARTQEETTRIAPAPVAQPAPAAAITKPVTLVARHSLTRDGAAKKDWGSLLARTAKSTHRVTQGEVAPMQKDAGPVFAVRENSAMAASTLANAPAEIAAVPAGFHDGYILSRLVQSRQPVSGLVVSIGVNTPRDADGSMPEPIRKLVESLIGPGDFACQSSSEEFLLIYPNERGASAQRRLSKIAQQLWDFQLRSLGSVSILFSWGGLEVSSESIDEAIASANERMHETRRGRKLLTMEPRGGQQLRQAV
jgi:hypothetical protein